MKIDFRNEITELNGELKRAENHLDCETIVLCNIKKHIIKEVKVSTIRNFMENLRIYFEEGTVIHKDTMIAIKYKHAAAFLNTIITNPHWYNWIKTANE